ncbi:GIY-YIG nuclease family protein [Endozoicomonas acroporae]|uniref:GIY-YIG nuclease family protein n=1 Tax=Endozoicomonas acroporae TaxID=1701104 RepID=UPI0013D032C1|nr:GIY-YIG nuclease family protein [Endozoicomonas acroporae]
MQEFVYVMTNNVIPGICKIGYSKDPELRAKQISSGTGVIGSFKVHFQIPGGIELEKKIHNLLRKERVSMNREFFRITPDDAVEVLKSNGNYSSEDILENRFKESDCKVTTKLRALRIKEAELLSSIESLSAIADRCLLKRHQKEIEKNKSEISRLLHPLCKKERELEILVAELEQKIDSKEHGRKLIYSELAKIKQQISVLESL